MASTDDCGPGYHMMPDGTCMVGDYHGASTSGMGSRMSSGYQRGGRARKRFQQGGHVHNHSHGLSPSDGAHHVHNTHHHQEPGLTGPARSVTPGSRGYSGQILNYHESSGNHNHAPGQSPMGGVGRSGTRLIPNAPATLENVRPGIPLGVGPATADNYLPNRDGSDWRTMAGRSRYRAPMRRGGRPGRRPIRRRR